MLTISRKKFEELDMNLSQKHILPFDVSVEQNFFWTFRGQILFDFALAFWEIVYL
jgi:hypothetical protein